MNARHFRLVALLEGVSLLVLVLVLVAMPLKYVLEQPLAVRIVGPLHGLFFLLYAVTLYDVILARVWPRGTTWLALAAAFIPGGTILSVTYARPPRSSLS